MTDAELVSEIEAQGWIVESGTGDRGPEIVATHTETGEQISARAYSLQDAVEAMHWRLTLRLMRTLPHDEMERVRDRALKRYRSKPRTGMRFRWDSDRHKYIEIGQRA